MKTPGGLTQIKKEDCGDASGDDEILKVWLTTGVDNYVCYSDERVISLGGGHCALSVESDFLHGTSLPNSTTFGNRLLSSKEDFIIKAFEVWIFEG